MPRSVYMQTPLAARHSISVNVTKPQGLIAVNSIFFQFPTLDFSPAYYSSHIPYQRLT